VLAHGRPHLKLSLKTLPKVAIAAAIGAAPALLGGVPAIGRVCLSTFLYATALLLLKAFPPDLLAILLPLRAKRQNSRF
jgi:hypothetical protein